ncbi:MAG: hypothetical protein K6A32_06870 [Bacteroidales bacterium]|nr:hypothetical protein [Bacteroidales bacterium]
MATSFIVAATTLLAVLTSGHRASLPVYNQQLLHRAVLGKESRGPPCKPCPQSF